MDWYLASLHMLSTTGSASGYQVRRYRYLIQAIDHEAAYQRSIELGNHIATETYTFAGVDDLLLIHEPPEDGSELSWSQLELTPGALESEIRSKQQIQAFKTAHPSRSGWYIATLAICEIHDEGSHGDTILTWINSYFLHAQNAESAHARAIQIGHEQEDPPGSHTCAGQKAHWEFKGIRSIIAAHNEPADGSLLWCDDFTVPLEQLNNLVTKKYDLSVFQWAAEQNRERKPSLLSHRTSGDQRDRNV
jgi:hypothetical protein